MGKLLQTLTLAGFTCYTLTTALTVQAQDTAPGKKNDKLGEYDEIIIKRKNNQDGKVTVEIKDGEVWADGKKLEDYDGDISVYKRKITPVDGNAFPFANPHRGLQFFNNDEDNDSDMEIRGGKALLGVITEKKEAAGVTVREVSKGSPAAKAGLKAGDMLTEFDGKQIQNLNDYAYALRSKKPGDVVAVVVKRNGEDVKTNVTLEARR